MTLTFVQLTVFANDMKRLGLGDEDVQALEGLLLEDPERGRVIPGAGGVRKVRFAPPSWNQGKSGGTRVIYAYFVKAAHVYFLLAYGKNEQANLTAEEKQMCRAIMQKIEDHLGTAGQ